MRYIYAVTHNDEEIKEDICLEELEVPCIEIVEERQGREYVTHSTVCFEKGEVLADSRGRGTMQTGR